MDCMEQFLRDVWRCYPKLKHDQQLELARRWRDERDQQAREQLILSIVPWAVRRASGYYRKIHGVIDIDTLVSLGLEGVIAGVDRFDPERGVRLTTFATYYIDRAMQKYLLESQHVIHLPCHLANRKRPSRRENVDLAARVREGVLELGRVNDGFARMDYPAEEWLIDKTADHERQYDDLDERNYKLGLLHEGMRQLRWDQRYVLRQRLKGTKLRVIGAIMGVTRERVRQIEYQAKQELRVIVAELWAEEKAG